MPRLASTRETTKLQVEVKNRKKRKYGNRNNSVAPRALVPVPDQHSLKEKPVGNQHDDFHGMKDSLKLGNEHYDNDINIRLSQACDRCRLKKIKCDGLKPSCTHCSKIKFACKTSDRLTRRGFPKGYTEMLERQVIELQHKLKLLETQSPSIEGNTSSVQNKKLIENCCSDNSTAQSSTLETEKNLIDRSEFWDVIIKDSLYSAETLLNEKFTKNFIDKEWLVDFQLSILISNLQLNPQYNYLPNFLINKANTNLAQLKELIDLSINNFTVIQNSILPLLYSNDDLVEVSNLTNNTINKNPINIMIICYIIQLNWSCFDKFKLFEVTKTVIINNYYHFKDVNKQNQNIKILNLLNLSIYYYMSVIDSNNLSIINDLFNITTVFINDALKTSNFINKDQIKNKPMKKSLDNDIYANYSIANRNELIKNRSISITCYKFLLKWWNLLHKKDIRLIANLNTEYDSDLLLGIYDEKLNLFKILNEFVSIVSTNIMLPNEQLSIHFQDYENVLIKKNLYFNNNENFLEKTLTTDECKSLQMTLYYLILQAVLINPATNNSLYTASKNNYKTKYPKKNQNITINDNSTLIQDQSKVENSFQILLKYHSFLTNGNFSLKDQPQQFYVKYFLPCQNTEIIRFSLLHLNSWSVTNTKKFDGDLTLPENWNLLRYKTFLTRFCTLWFFDDMKNVLLVELQNNFKFDLSLKLKLSNTNLNKYNKLGYLQSVSNFNDTNKIGNGYNFSFFFGGRTNLLKCNSDAIMDQFDMFTDNNIVDPTNTNPDLEYVATEGNIGRNQNIANAEHAPSMRDHLENCKPNIVDNTGFYQPLFESFSLKSLTQLDGNNNLVDVGKYSSEFLLNQEETDDGYAEDDDEDDFTNDNLQPLEIPFVHKRHKSLFQSRYDRSPATLIKTKEYMNKNKVAKNNQSSMTSNVSAIILPGNAQTLQDNQVKLDHMILNNSLKPVSHEPLSPSAVNCRPEATEDSKPDERDNTTAKYKTDGASSLNGHKAQNLLQSPNKTPSFNNFNFIETTRSFSDMLFLKSNSQLNLLKKIQD
ncbi:hypothetical protein TPHA_0I02820 [Tetrapisispora phaffii CBS 4417]|uniref:Zn(2)-C6 fungal-type domain-containing protein n=1 Tax=Tetrapisispora phaffii (strain ATCC 24235 / CBS 4417 / NBRC 1672 / NRRL Y-8282 / UCD 70-5) TaxID=1071381 RepID=G8BY05_TETPH|nr:hypothetical protein TPHA_0I02820 [Tetrapisispora phaffii CBS 4417]CCE64783.1 hypothetical protein TPHA_0I02820 [Tetrapisispora phaffii CBS 4417]